MSGGSYDYLCFADADDILTRTSSLVQMAERLDDLCPEAAAETRALFAGAGSLYTELERRLARLTDLWHDVEWRDSGDYGDRQLTEAIEKYRAQGPAPRASRQPLSAQLHALADRWEQEAPTEPVWDGNCAALLRCCATDLRAALDTEGQTADPQVCGVDWTSGPTGATDCTGRDEGGPCVCALPLDLPAHGPRHRCQYCDSTTGRHDVLTEETLAADRVRPGGIIPNLQVTDRQYRRFARRWHLARQLPMRQLHEDGTSTRLGRRLPWWRYASIKVRMWLA